MADKLLGIAVWYGAKLYLRRRLRDARQKLVIAGLAAAVVGVVIAAQRQQSTSGQG